MDIRLGYELSFEVPRPTPMQLMLYVHPEQASRLRQPERIDLAQGGLGRDFQPLAVRFLRALNLPPRCAAGFRGDIGVPASPSPMDFSAGSEVYLDGSCRLLDARHNQPRIGRVLMARGRDA